MLFYEKITTLSLIFCKKKSPFSKNVALMPIVCCKKMSILSKNGALMSFFSNCVWKTPFCHAHDWSKSVKSVKTTLYCAPKRSIGWYFFRKKIIAFMPIFCQKTSILLKKHLFCPYFVKKMFILSKTLCSHVIFFKIFHKNHLLSCPK